MPFELNLKVLLPKAFYSVTSLLTFTPTSFFFILHLLLVYNGNKVLTMSIGNTTMLTSRTCGKIGGRGSLKGKKNSKARKLGSKQGNGVNKM
jgi:hypothetical protein